MNPDTNAHPAKTAGSSWLDVLIASLTSSQVSPLGEALPAFPPEELQRNTTGLSSEAALRHAYAFYEDVCDATQRAGVSLGPGSRVLDFGFGWGRISRVFMKDVRTDQIFGVDVDPDFVALTRDLFRSTNFTACPPFPPTAFPDAHFDLISAYSVFSHLSEEACLRWMQEFARILKPGGLVVCTTRDESFFGFLDWASKQQATDGYLRALGELFPDLQSVRARYRRGELVHASSPGVSGGGPRNSHVLRRNLDPGILRPHRLRQPPGVRCLVLRRLQVRPALLRLEAQAIGRVGGAHRCVSCCGSARSLREGSTT